MSPELTDVLKAWLIAATSKEPPADVQEYGLCYMAHALGGTKACKELTEILHAEFQDFLYPFNGEGMQSYWDAAQQKTQHLNPKRLEWVRKKLGLAL